ncbi:MAG: hypothetical protein DRO87_09910 [Candidatus Thorarchaeota archaeon]|nr:MAG: hypothetical protein DRO87_09910 [Candidatus Thorarchaeota archaeon]
MATFYTTLTNEEMAAQIADLLNQANRLRKVHSKSTILSSHSIYFVELCEDKVIGCVGLTKVTSVYSIVHHASVRPEYRKRGVGKKLLKLAVSQCETQLVYGRIREDNIASLKMSFSVGFKFVQKEPKQGYNLILVGRTGGYL